MFIIHRDPRRCENCRDVIQTNKAGKERIVISVTTTDCDCPICYYKSRIDLADLEHMVKGVNKC